MTRDTAILLDIVSTVFHPQEASRVSFALHLSPFTHMQLYRRLQHISTSGSLRLATRLHAGVAQLPKYAVHCIFGELGKNPQVLP